MQRTRRQLSLYVPTRLSAELEAARQLLDPVQHRLIPAHVTLCREDEIESLTEWHIEQRLMAQQARPLVLQFAQLEVFAGHGILLKCIRGESEFHALRQLILATTDCRLQNPHITLAHPRNPRAPGNSLARATQLANLVSIEFDTVSLIGQHGDRPWQLLRTYDLAGQSDVERFCGRFR